MKVGMQELMYASESYLKAAGQDLASVNFSWEWKKNHQETSEKPSPKFFWKGSLLL